MGSPQEPPAGVNCSRRWACRSWVGRLLPLLLILSNTERSCQEIIWVHISTAYLYLTSQLSNSYFLSTKIEFHCPPGRPHPSLQVPVDNVQTHVLGREGWQWPDGNWKISPLARLSARTPIFCIIAISPKCQRSLWSCLTWTSSSFSLAPRLPEKTIRPPTCI